MEELRGYLEERFNALDGRLAAVDGRLTAVEDRLTSLAEDVCSLNVRVDALDQTVRRLGVRLDRVDSDVRSVADGHMLLFEGMTRRHEEIRDDMAEVRSRVFYPTAPSISRASSRFNSTAYSMGSSRVKGSMKPIRIMLIACCSDRPRLIR